ncbi:MAG: glycosyltransferase family 2 protein [Ignisphaera sp.]
MSLPKVSIIWLNYNSMKIVDLVLESLKAVSEFDYPNNRYELIVVDNGSTDGSFEKIKAFLEMKDNLRKKIIRLSSNLWFIGGNNVGFKARDKDSKYVVILNNDAVPFKESLKTMVEYAEQYNVGGLSGIILKYGGGNLIDTAGDVMDELLYMYHIGVGKPAPWIVKKPFYITYADGAYALYRVDCILKSMGEKLFFNEFLSYGDDNVLGLVLWNNGYKVIAIPEIIATHRRGTTFRKQHKIYLGERNRIALSYITNTKYKLVIKLHTLRVTLPHVFESSYRMRVLYDGIKLGRILRSKYNLLIDVYKAPILNLSLEELVLFYFIGSKRKLLKFHEEKVVKTIKKWEAD